MSDGAQTATIETRIPARLDRLPWARFHWSVVIGLGTVWILDGLEVTIVGFLAPTLVEPGSGIELSEWHISLAAAIYVAGACFGALFFGQLTDRFGRKRLFLITLPSTSPRPSPRPSRRRRGSSSWPGSSPAPDRRRVRGDQLGDRRADPRASPWQGGPDHQRLLLARRRRGGLLSLVLLQESLFALDVGWRVAFGLGALLGLGILLVRRHVPESPRWLFIHGREEEAERIVDDIERRVEEETGEKLESEPGESITVRQRKRIPFREIARTAFKDYPKRSTLGLSLFAGQAFLYNAVTFTLGLTLTTYLGVGANKVGLFYAVFAAGNFLGPLVLGRLFDTVGRRPMIAGTYLASAVMLVVVAILFNGEQFSDWGLIAALGVTFFFASAGASSAYLTVSEIFPMEVRALAIAFFYAIGTAIGGISGPLVFEKLASSGDPGQVAIGYLIGAAVMAIGGIVELFLGVRAEQQQLEDIAKPLTAEEAERDEAEAPDAASRREDLSGAIAPAERDRAGLRRFRPGLGSASFSPFIWQLLGAVSARQAGRDHRAALGSIGRLPRQELARRAEARRHRGPGVFRRALGDAVSDGIVRRLARDRDAPRTAGRRPSSGEASGGTRGAAG